MSEIRITTRKELRNIARLFAKGTFQPVMLVGPPGTFKTQTIRRAFGKSNYLYLKGRVTALSFFEALYGHRNTPVVLDDTSEMLRNKDVQELLRDLMEHTEERTISWRTQSRILQEKALPQTFTTRSPICVVSNQIGDGGVWPALLSRCHHCTIEFDWREVCSAVRKSGWFKGHEEILAFAETHATGQGDVRRLIKAKDRRQNKLKDWRQLFDSSPLSLSRADKLVEKVFGLVVATPGLNRKELHRGCGNNLQKGELGAALETLIAEGRIHRAKVPGVGRPPERFWPAGLPNVVGFDFGIRQETDPVDVGDSLAQGHERTKDETSTSALSSFVPEGESLADSSTVVVKRGRGRPRKNPLPENPGGGFLEYQTDIHPLTTPPRSI